MTNTENHIQYRACHVSLSNADRECVKTTGLRAGIFWFLLKIPDKYLNDTSLTDMPI
jgi:hypothetical protein